MEEPENDYRTPTQACLGDVSSGSSVVSMSNSVDTFGEQKSGGDSNLPDVDDSMEGGRGSDPEIFTNSESVDALLANELNKLTFRERESINEEIHGINVDRKYIEESGVVEETPEILANAFRDLQQELETERNANGGTGGTAYAFNRSQELFGSTPEEGTYLNTNEFRLMFLRCDRFDCQKAAKRICRYADMIYDLYGDMGLERRAKLTDFDETEMAIVQKGLTQVFPGRDRAGRRIYAHFASSSYVHLPVKTRLRIAVYHLLSVVSNDVVSQRRGIVIVMWYHDLQRIDIGDFVNRGKTNSHSTYLPIQVSACHFCFPTLESSKSEAALHLVKRLARGIAPRLRVHVGSRIESAYILESFGITCKQNPLNITTGELDVSNHMRWLAFNEFLEENRTQNKQIIECPNYSDILFGRGQIVMNHPGNIVFRNFVQSNLKVYLSVGSKKASTQWTWGVVRTLKKEYGARFLKEERIDKNVTAWVEVSNEVARSKIRIAFRDARTRLSKVSEKQASAGDPSGLNSTNQSNAPFAMPVPSSETSSSLLSKRKNTTTTESEHLLSWFTPSQKQEKEQNQPFQTAVTNIEEFNSNMSTLNSNLSTLNNNLNTLMDQPIVDSSTSSFLGMDGTTQSKRPRLCSHKFFDCT